MRALYEIEADVFNGLGPSLDADEQLSYSFVHGEADAVARGLTHYLDEGQRLAALEDALSPATQNIMEAEIAPPSDNNSSTQVVGLPLLEIPALTLGQLPEGLLVLANEPPVPGPSSQDVTKAIKLPKPVKK